jgi:hypothetical protein
VQKKRSALLAFFLTEKSQSGKYLMIKRLFYSQFRIKMASGTVTTAINAVVMVIAYPIYLRFLGYEKYGVWLILATVLIFVQSGNPSINQAITKLVAEQSK